MRVLAPAVAAQAASWCNSNNSGLFECLEQV
jgi:hypothetical protein